MADEVLDYSQQPSRSQSMFSGLALAFPGILLMVFGLPLAVCLPAGIVFGHARLNIWGYLILTACSIFGAIFIYGATLLLKSATKAFKGQ